MSTFIKKSPTRVDFSGGTLDCWPLYLMVDSAKTINLCIDILTEAKLTVRSDSQIQVLINDLNYEKTFKNLAAFLESKDEELSLIGAHIRHWKPPWGFTLSTASQSPVGGGLGGSSSLSMGLIDVFAKASKVELGENERVQLSANLEAQVLKKPTGTQDYFPSYLKGLNAIHYTPSGFRTENLDVDLNVIEGSLSLIYTGKPHHSGINNWSVIRAVFDGDQKILKVLGEIKDISEKVYEALRNSRFDLLPDLFNQEVEARVRLSPAFSSPEIIALKDVALSAGSQAVKICGAGGGGCVALWSPPEKKKQVEAVCANAGFRVLPVKPVTKPFVTEVQA